MGMISVALRHAARFPDANRSRQIEFDAAWFNSVIPESQNNSLRDEPLTSAMELIVLEMGGVSFPERKDFRSSFLIFRNG